MSDIKNNQQLPNNPNDKWEQQTLNKILFASLEEQKRARRWGYLFKFGMLAYLFAILYIIQIDFSSDKIESSNDEKHTALIEINGVIADDEDASADNVIASLRDAFKDENTAGVIIRINSPGGSPVQSGYINDEIVRLREKYPEIPTYTVVTDICASGGYYIAVATEKIYVDKASMVGSIGVLMSSFGFVDAMKKLGIERRLLTAGEHKAMLDPFSVTKPESTEHIKTLLEEVHQQFITVVKNGRGDSLSDNPDIFSGLIWNGEQAVELGLADGLGSSSYVARELIEVENIVVFSQKTTYVERLIERLGKTMANTFVKTLELKTFN
jgi:protease-4